MSSILSWIKKEFTYLKDSSLEIIKGLILVILATAGLGCAIFLRYLGFNGIVITFSGIITEIISLLLCYFVFRDYLKTEEKTAESNAKGIKK